jgi:hypothetical protein
MADEELVFGGNLDATLTISGTMDSVYTGVSFCDQESYNKWIKEPVIAIDLPCGCKREYDMKCDMLEEQCSHGNWFIRIGEKNG